MCEFISWKEYQGKILFLTKDVIAPRLEDYKKFNPNWQQDIRGHGAIEWFYGLPTGCGKNQERTDFLTAPNLPNKQGIIFPSQIVKAIKRGDFEGIEICLDILTPPAQTLYNETVAPARKLYNETVATAQTLYDETVAPARKLFDETVAPAFWDLAKQEKNRREEWK